MATETNTEAVNTAQQPSKKKKRKIWPLILLILLFIVGMGILLYPFIANLWNSHIQQQLISAYNDNVQEISDNDPETYEREWEKAFAYNDSLWPTPNPENFAFLNDNDPTPEYMDCLNIHGDGIMGYVEVPKINVTIPIYHTTDEEDVLSKGAEHLEGTSLPIGGESTHCVLSAHRGLPGSMLFTDLDQMEEGDHFFLDVLDQKLCYEVDQILVVEPDDVSALVIEDGKDYCTLLTCTPYGVNTHRLLVRGHQVPYEEEYENESGSLFGGENSWYQWSLIAACVAFIVFVILLITMLRKPKKKKAKKVVEGTGEDGGTSLPTDTNTDNNNTKSTNPVKGDDNDA